MQQNPDEITIHAVTITDAAAYAQVYELREEILRKPIGLSLKNEDLSADADDTIVIAKKGNDIIGCVMIHPVNEPGIIKLRQMAVAEQYQGKGIGKLLMVGAEKIIIGQGLKKIVLHARITAKDFYKNLGYITTSDVFTEVGIPHIVMEKELS